MKSNKKGSWEIRGWGDLAKALTVISILLVLLQQMGIFSGPSTNTTQNPQTSKDTTPTVAPPLPFEPSNISIQFLPQKTENKYSNSNTLICYFFNNPSGKTNGNFTLVGEWFTDNAILPSANYTEGLDYKDIFERTRLNWYSVGNYSKIRFRVGLSLDKKILADTDINYNLTKDANLDKYLSKEENITWNDSTIKELINETNLCGKNDEEQIKEVLSFVRNKMNLPLKTDETIYYDQNQLSSEESWNKKTGTSSEYSYVFASFLRAIGIPAKIETINLEYNTYYYVKAYVQGKGWWRVDVFQKNKEIKDCSILSKLDRDVEHKGVCIPELSDYIIFDKVVAHKSVLGPKLEYTVQNVYTKPVEVMCIKVNISFFDKNGTAIFSAPYILFDDTETTQVAYPPSHKDLDFESIKLQLAEFSCK